MPYRAPAPPPDSRPPLLPLLVSALLLALSVPALAWVVIPW